MSSSSTITRKSELLNIPTGGEILREEFLKPLDLSQNALARAVAVPPRRINEIVLGKPGVTADTDLRRTRYFGLPEGYFLRLQMVHDIREERRLLGKKRDAIKPRAA
jgi:addiction module HigA family antidote